MGDRIGKGWLWVVEMDDGDGWYPLIDCVFAKAADAKEQATLFAEDDEHNGGIGCSYRVTRYAPTVPGNGGDDG